MATNDFDFEKEYGFSEDSIMGDGDFTDSDFTDEELGLTPMEGEDYASDDSMTDDQFLNMSQTAKEEAPAAEPAYEEAPVENQEAFTEGSEVIDQSVFEDESDDEEDEDEEDEDDEEEYDEEEYDEDDDEDSDMDERRRRQRMQFKLPKINLPEIKLPKLTTPNIFTKFYDLYFAPVLDKTAREEQPDPSNPRRRRRKNKYQLFKEVYLPPLIICVTLILVLSFTIGSISNAIERKKIEDSLKQSQISSSEDAAALQEQEFNRIMAEAKELAAGYNYEAAVGVLDTFTDIAKYPEMQTLRAEYVTAQGQLVEHKDLSMIPNLSFHVLMVDPVRAFADTELGGSYNKNFITTAEFSRILEDLYANGYVLVDFDSVTASQTDSIGNQVFMPKPIKLPSGKKPIMLTETMVNYFPYMIDSNDDGMADSGGDGFASRLVVQNGTIEAEYMDATGQTMIGDYDFVPVLEAFIAEHPDFSYQGARATLAVCGYEGIFGYRTNTAYIASKGQDYYNNEVAGATEVVETLREMGYKIACYSYGNKNYADMSANQIQEDLRSWTSQITPIVGEVDTIVYARGTDITDYSQTAGAFKVLYSSGFRYFVAAGTQPWAELNNSYVRQRRLMVTGETMQWYSDRFNGMFDCAAILDVNSRGSVPKS